MSKLSKIKARAAKIAGRSDDEQVGPNRGTMDQEEARIERARQEARQEAERERVQQRANEAREQERERVLSEESGGGGIVSSIANTIETAADAVDDGDGQRLDDVSRAMGSDFDGDGETLADELGLQSAARADVEDESLSGLSGQVDRNTGRIGGLEDRFSEQGGMRRQRQPGGRSGAGGGGAAFGGDDFGGQRIDPAEFGLGGDGSSGQIDPEEFGFGDGDGSGGFGFGGGR